MSLDRSLKSASTLVRHRNVLTRAERLSKLKEVEKWREEKNSPLGLTKVGHRKAALAKAEKKVEGEEGAVAGAAPAAGAAKGAAAGKGAAAAKGAPAAKGAAAA